METPNAPIVEQEDGEDLAVRIGVDVAEEDIKPDEDGDDEVLCYADFPGFPTRVSIGSPSVNETFLDWKYTASRTAMQTPPKVMEEGGDTFLRITGRIGDRQSIPKNYPNRVRATMTFTSNYMSMPNITDANMRQTYQVEMRVNAPCPNGAAVLELFQYAPGGEGAYGQQNGTGPAARITVVRGRAKFETRYQNERKVDVHDLGVASNEWHTYRIVAVWSHNPSKGRFDVFVDGKLKHTIRRDVNLGPSSSKLPCVKVGLYGDNAAGTCDVKNLHVNPTGGSIPAPIPPIPIPEPPVERVTRAISCGGAVYTAMDAVVYAADWGFAGGRKELMPNAITGTDDVPLYQSWRYGNCIYTVPCANGAYLVTLHFAEHLHTEPDKRVFDVSLEGVPVITRLDVFAQVGHKAAYVVEIPATVTDGAMTVSFEGLVGNAMISAIKMKPM